MNEIDKFLHVKRLQSGTVADRTVNPLSKRQSGAVIERPTLRGTGRAVRTVEKERGSISLSGSKKERRGTLFGLPWALKKNSAIVARKVSQWRQLRLGDRPFWVTDACECEVGTTCHYDPRRDARLGRISSATQDSTLWSVLRITGQLPPFCTDWPKATFSLYTALRVVSLWQLLLLSP